MLRLCMGLFLKQYLLQTYFVFSPVCLLKLLKKLMLANLNTFQTGLFSDAYHGS